MGRGYVHLNSSADWKSFCACTECEKIYWGADKAIACCKRKIRWQKNECYKVI